MLSNTCERITEHITNGIKTHKFRNIKIHFQCIISDWVVFVIKNLSGRSIMHACDVLLSLLKSNKHTSIRKFVLQMR